MNIGIKGGNYGWRKYEGTSIFSNDVMPTSDSTIFPAFQYNHNALPACIIGGYVYRGNQDKCNYGNYLFGDLTGKFRIANEGHISWSVNLVNWKCSINSILSCPTVINAIYSFGEDSISNLYVLTSEGLLQIIDPSNCNLSCNDTYN